ncbi:MULTISPECIES: hypothetical protein [Cyanophyceae]|nr:hypothetical protein [Nodosilinea sp. FACHB-141]
MEKLLDVAAAVRRPSVGYYGFTRSIDQQLSILQAIAVKLMLK